MGFAADYLLKAGLRETLFTKDPSSDLKLIVTIPVHRESGLARCLDSLFMALPLPASEALPASENAEDIGALGSLGTLGTTFRCEVLILINAAAGAPAEVHRQNQATLSEVKAWIAAHPHPLMDFYVMLDHSFGPKEAGVGVARKILMDEAARRFSLVGNPDGIIASMDADTVVDPDYFSALAHHFEQSSCEGCSIRFEHPLEGQDLSAADGAGPDGDFSAAVYEAIARYELHLHYYVAAVRSTGYPYAFHTVGSAFAVKAGIYCLEGGMNKRQGGEDFYFIQKVAQRGNWSECNSTRVVPSPRPSDRVPFGTGPVVGRLVGQLESGGSVSELSTYHPEPFRMLREFFGGIDKFYRDAAVIMSLELSFPVLSEFLVSQKFPEALDEIRSNSGSAEAFRKRFWRWFNMFRIMKFLHFAREHGYPDMEVGEAVHSFLALEKSCTVRELLGLFRTNS